MPLKDVWIYQDETMDASPDIPNMLADAIIENEKDISDIESDILYTNSQGTPNAVGGIPAGTTFNNVKLSGVLNQLLYPYTKPVINSFSLSPSAGAKEKNVSMTVQEATVKVTKKSRDIASVSLYKGNTIVEEKTDEISSSGTTLTFKIYETLDGITNTSYTIKVVEDGDNPNTITSSQSYTFVYPYYYGVIENRTTVGSETILGFDKGIRIKGSHSYTYDTNNQHPVIAYPKSYGALKSIIDPNNFTQTWTLNEVYTDDNVPYYVYIGGVSTATNVTYQFNY